MTSIPFITYSPTLGFQLTPQTESFLSSISQTPISVLSVVGNYRTGKSFFINRVLLNKSNGKGFTVGPSINPCTKGLWLWTEPLEHQNPDVSNDVKVLLIDSEGFGGMDQNLSHNSRIGLFSLLLSSYFIYNSLGIIDENSLNSLSLIVSLGQEVMKQGESSGIFPTFLWVLRDFALQMINADGENISNKEYLDKALEINNKMSEGKNKVRKMIREIFVERDCLTLVRPVGDERDLQRLDCLDEKFFRKEFSQQIKKARNMIFSQIKPKKINGKIITAGLLLELCKNFITVINGDKVPDIKTTWVYLCKSQITTNFSACMAYAEIEYDRLKTIELGLDDIKLNGKRVKNEVKEKLRKNLMGLCDKNELKELFQKLKDFIKTQNKELKNLVFENIKKKAHVFLEDKMISFKNNLDLNPACYLKEYKSLQEYFKNNNLIDNDLIEYHQNLLKVCLENFFYEMNNTKKNIMKVNDQRILLLEQDLQNKKQQFLFDKDCLEKKIVNLEVQIQQYRKKEAVISSKKNIASQTIVDFPRENEEFKKEYEKKCLIIIQEKNGIIIEKNRATQTILLLQKELADLKTDKALIDKKSEETIAVLQRELVDLQANFEKNQMQETANKMKVDNNKTIETIGILQRELIDLKNKNESSIKNNSISNNNHYKILNEPEGELIQLTNRALAMTLERSEEQTKLLKEKIVKLKEFKTAYKNSLQFQCKNCQKFIVNSYFLDHCNKNLCSKDKEIFNIYSSLNEIPDNKSLNLSNIMHIQTASNKNSMKNLSIATESQLICEEILNPIQENIPIMKQKENSQLMFQKKKESLEELIERLNKNEKYSILQAKKREMLSPKGSIINNDYNYKSTLKKEQKKTNNFIENSVIGSKKADRILTLQHNLWDNVENENPCSQRFESTNFLFKSVRNCDIVARKNEERAHFFKNKVLKNNSGI